MSGRMKTVERGAALLDERMPGWEEKIDLDKLNLSRACNCIVGQLFVKPRERKTYLRYERGLEALGIEMSEAGRFGFMTINRGRFSNLTAAWRDLITRRRMEKAS